MLRRQVFDKIKPLVRVQLVEGVVFYDLGIDGPYVFEVEEHLFDEGPLLPLQLQNDIQFFKRRLERDLFINLRDDVV